MADVRPQYIEEAVGANHPTKADVINRAWNVEHDEDGTHKKYYVKVSDVKAQGVDGGTFTQGAWRTRDINVEDSDDAGICSIAANQITLEAGTYICSISCPAYFVDYHKAQLYNISDASQTLLGTAEFTSAVDVVTRSYIVGQFTIAAQKIFEIQHWCTLTKANQGFGVRANVAGSEIYTLAEFWKMG